MQANFTVSYKEPSWEWDESPTEYFSTLDDARNFFQRAVQQDGRFRCFRLEGYNSSREWAVLEEIDLGPRKNSN
jgi:hypothetical protein